MANQLNKKARHMVMLLRHDPQGLSMDKQAYVAVQDIINFYKITKDDLDRIVASDNKTRFGYNHDQTKIRANQGHSLDFVNIKFNEITLENLDNYFAGQTQPFIYHGTAQHNLDSINEKGLLKMDRTHVHLSFDRETASKVGTRHKESKDDDLVVLELDVQSYLRAGNKLYVSENNVVLADEVEPKFLGL